MRRYLAAAAIVCALFALALPARAQGVSPALMFGCNQSAIYDASTNGSTKLVTGVAVKQIYVCGWNIFWGGTATVKLTYGTGGTCGTGTTAITPAFSGVAQSYDIDPSSVYKGLTPVPASNDLCITTSAGVAVQAIVYYSQF